MVRWTRFSKPRYFHSRFSHSTGTSGCPLWVCPQQQPLQTLICPSIGRLVETAVVGSGLIDTLDIIENDNAFSFKKAEHMDIFSSRSPRSSERTNEIKAQVAVALDLDEEATVMVSELACMEEGCPPVETVIAVFRPAVNKLQFRLHRPILEITAHDIEEMCAQQVNSSSEKNHGNCCS